MGPEMGEAACMICRLPSDPLEQIILLCDDCDCEAHLACAGLSRVPAGEWFCPHCRPRGRVRGRPRPKRRPRAVNTTKPPHRHPQMVKSSLTRCESGDIDEIDGIVIEAFAGPLDDNSEDAHVYSRPKKQSKLRHRNTSKAQAQARPFRHQLLFSTCTKPLHSHVGCG